MKRMSITMGLAAAAALLAPGMMVGPSPVEGRTIIQGESIPGRPTIPLSAFREEEIFDETAFRELVFGFRSRGGNGLPRHLRPGERAHRRWRHARASGIKGASRS